MQRGIRLWLPLPQLCASEMWAIDVVHPASPGSWRIGLEEVGRVLCVPHNNPRYKQAEKFPCTDWAQHVFLLSGYRVPQVSQLLGSPREVRVPGDGEPAVTLCTL